MTEGNRGKRGSWKIPHLYDFLCLLWSTLTMFAHHNSTPIKIEVTEIKGVCSDKD